MKKRLCTTCKGRLAPGEHGRCLKCRSGWIYFVEAVGDSAVKVGWCMGTRRNLNMRLAALRCANHRELRVIGACVGTHADEKRLHDSLASWRIHHEWFHLHDESWQVMDSFAHESGGHVVDAEAA